MKSFLHTKILSACALLQLVLASAALGQSNDQLVGIWTIDEGFQVVELLFRSDGRYQLDTINSDPTSELSFSERGRYQADGLSLSMTPYSWFGTQETQRYHLEQAGDSLTLTTAGDFPVTRVYQFKPGSKADVLARQNVEPVLIGSWKRRLIFFGQEEYTFRPGGYYFVKRSPDSGEFPPEYIRGRYEQNGDQLTLRPYSGTEVNHEIDFFGNTLTIIRKDEFSGDSLAYEEVPGSEAEVRAKAAEAEAFLSRPNWQVGLWEIRDGFHTVDLTLRPDGYYSSTNAVEILRGMVRGRYTLEPARIHFFPFTGQGLYSRDNGDFGKVERTRELDYYDGELQLIELDAISQRVALARKVPGSDEAVAEKARQARAERAQQDWQVGIWEVNDPAGWMQFTFRPDNRYIAQSGSGGSPSQVERGRYALAGNKITLAPYPGLGAPRGFELDLYDGNLFLVGDAQRMVIARKIPGSSSEVVEKTRQPAALQGERGSILGLWTANLPGQSTELVFRPDGQFRLTRCGNNALSHDYGLYSVNMAARTLVYDSRFVNAQTQELDFYGDTMTIFGGLGAPSTYTVNLGIVDAAIAASLAADAQEAQVDAGWLARVPIGPRNPNAVHLPVGDIPADPNPGRIFEDPTVFTGYHLYRRLIPGFVYFNHLGEIRCVPVVHTREWHFFPTGRVLVRFKNYRAGLVYPATAVDVSDSWGAYVIGPKPEEQDILHLFADNSLLIDTDLGEQLEMTLEDGRRHLFWGKDYQILSEWAAEQKPEPCQPPADANASLMNTGVSLTTSIPPDETGEGQPLQIQISGPVGGALIISGTLNKAGTLAVEGATGITPPIVWETLQTNSLPAGPFSFRIPQGPSAALFFRVRQL